MIGLFQDVGFGNMHSVGNAAGDGARMALMNRAKREEAEHIARKHSLCRADQRSRALCRTSWTATLIAATKNMHFPH
jgi:uncharacterized 2Fe-2S/4Fe-4S cluster protein (DUF4445 family)